MNMTCSGNGNRTHVTWLHNGYPVAGQLSARVSLSLSSRVILICSLKMEDAGMYQCETANSFTYNKSEPFYLNVLSEWPLLPHIFLRIVFLRTVLL